MSIRPSSLLRVVLLLACVSLAAVAYPLHPPGLGSGFGTAHAQAGPGEIGYIYDELNRLLAVVDPGADTAVYTYDPVGNITAIGRQPSSQVSVLLVDPAAAPVG